MRIGFLARHGQAHRVIPSEIPFRANIHALQSLGVRYVIAVSPVGSLREEIRPLDIVVPDQFIDLTRQRAGTFFGQGAVAHVSMADPVCPAVSGALAKAARAIAQGAVQVHTCLY